MPGVDAGDAPVREVVLEPGEDLLHVGLTDADLRDLGSIVLGGDLDAAEWPLHKLGMVRRAAGHDAGRPAVHPRRGIQAARNPPRPEWVKGSDGRIDRAAIPAELAPGDLAGWLRARCLAAARDVATDLPLLRERKAPRKYKAAALALMGEHSRHGALGPEAILLVSEALTRTIDLVKGDARDAVLLILEGYSTQEAAQRVGVTARSVNRYLQSLRKRVTEPASSTSPCPCGPGGGARTASRCAARSPAPRRRASSIAPAERVEVSARRPGGRFADLWDGFLNARPAIQGVPERSGRSGADSRSYRTVSPHE